METVLGLLGTVVVVGVAWALVAWLGSRGEDIDNTGPGGWGAM